MLQAGPSFAPSAINDMTHTDSSDKDEGRDRADMGIKVPEGYVLVPIVPTKEMLEAGWAPALSEDAADTWEAMVAASPLANP